MVEPTASVVAVILKLDSHLQVSLLPQHPLACSVASGIASFRAFGGFCVLYILALFLSIDILPHGVFSVLQIQVSERRVQSVF